MNVRKKISKILILLILTTIFSTTFFNPKPAFAISTIEPYMGQISLFTFGYAPMGWAECSGQILACTQNSALYSLIGTKFGGNGSTTFGLPNLQNASPLPNAKYYIAMQGIYPQIHDTAYDMGGYNDVIGAIAMFPYTPNGWALCNGATLNSTLAIELYSLIGTSYGGDSTNFKVPNLSNVAPIANMNYYICVSGIYPSFESIGSEDFLGNVNLVAFTINSTPNDALKATGQTISIAQNSALFALMGTNYGGNGTTTFGIPDLRGATPSPQMHYYVTTQGYFPSHS